VHPRLRTLARQGDCCRSPCFTLVVEHRSAGWGTFMLRRLLSLAFVTLGLTAPMASVGAQPFTPGAAASAISAANALSARIRSYHRWQGLTPPPASYCATMREGEARQPSHPLPGARLGVELATGGRPAQRRARRRGGDQSAGRYALHALPLSGTSAVSGARARAQDRRRKGACLSQAGGCASRVVRSAPIADAEMPAHTGNVGVIACGSVVATVVAAALGCHGQGLRIRETTPRECFPRQRDAATTLTNLACRSAPL